MKAMTVAIVCVLAACAGTGSKATNPDAEAQFERMKTLEGVWVRTSGPTEPDASSEVRYHTTAGGTVLVETISPGTPQEMVSMMHLDGGALVLTHYCVLGNQPTMTAESSADLSKIRFQCIGGGNLDCARDRHMHSAEFDFTDRDHLHSVWKMNDGAKVVETAAFDLVRKAK